MHSVQRLSYIITEYSLSRACLGDVCDVGYDWVWLNVLLTKGRRAREARLKSDGSPSI